MCLRPCRIPPPQQANASREQGQCQGPELEPGLRLVPAIAEEGRKQAGEQEHDLEPLGGIGGCSRSLCSFE